MHSTEETVPVDWPNPVLGRVPSSSCDSLSVLSPSQTLTGSLSGRKQQWLSPECGCQVTSMGRPPSGASTGSSFTRGRLLGATSCRGLCSTGLDQANIYKHFKFFVCFPHLLETTLYHEAKHKGIFRAQGSWQPYS